MNTQSNSTNEAQQIILPTKQSQQNLSNFIVMKFGGSSQCLQGLQLIKTKIDEYVSLGKKVILVISAVGKTTNNLYEITNHSKSAYKTIYDVHKQLCQDVNIDFAPIEQLLLKLEKDAYEYKTLPFLDLVQSKLKIISWGEILASYIVWLYLNKNSTQCEFLRAHSFIKVSNVSSAIDSDTLNIKGDFYCDKHVLFNMIGLHTNHTHNVCVTQGFVATTLDNKYCVLTRSGSNTSASLIANAVDAEKLEIYTDVSGIFSGDPRKIPNAKVIPMAKYEFCLEASSTGTNLVHPFSIRPCLEKNIPIHIKNTFNPTSMGSIIGNTNLPNTYLISIQSNVTIFKIYSMNMSEGYGFMADIFGVFRDEKIDVNIVTSSQFEITTTTNEKSLQKIERARLQLLKRHSQDNEHQYNVNVISGCAIISVIADDVLHNEKIDQARRLVLRHNIKPVYISVPSSNNLAWSFVVDESNSQILANLLHEFLFNSEGNSEDDFKAYSKKRKTIDVGDTNNMELTLGVDANE